jgi:superfamily I DNA/RNA helicase
MARQWSTYQNNIFDFVENGVGSAIVRAVAGSGKTTTICHADSLLPEYCTSILLAFNKSIAEELKARGVNARTFHSVTYSPVTRFKGTRQVDADKLSILVQQHLSGDDAFIYGHFIKRLVGLARQVGIGCLVDDVEASWVDIVAHYDLELDNESGNLGRALELASDLLGWSNQSDMVDFDDLLYMAVREGIVLPKYDVVFVDEAQDTNAIQRALLRKMLKPTSRVIAVGDPAQAIYGFRGADSNSMDLIAKEFNCVELPLTVSYRCPAAVVEHAQQWAPQIEAAPGAPMGVVENLGKGWELTTFQPGDLILCRTTKPLVTLAFKFIKAKIKACILGREIGQGLKTLIKRMNAKNIDALATNLENWAARETEKAVAKCQDSKVEAIGDKLDTMLFLIQNLLETDRTIPALLAVIDQLFSDATNVVTLATIHKAKGMEAPRVYWLNSSQCPAPWAKQPWQQQQEMNLCYVATTRAQAELYLIEDSSVKRPR